LLEEAASLLLADIFCGLCYLTLMNIVHGQLSLANIFLDKEGAKIGGLGDGTIVSHLGFERINFKKAQTGPLHNLAPENLMNNNYSHKSDIWAFGLVCY
jgi:serine/threonine protein kinase